METTILKLRTQACQEALTLTHVNRFAVLDTVADDEVQDNDQNERFTTVRSNRHKRAREHSSPTQAVAAEAPSEIAVRQRRGPLVLGKSSSASVVAAANTYQLTYQVQPHLLLSSWRGHRARRTSVHKEAHPSLP